MPVQEDHAAQRRHQAHFGLAPQQRHLLCSGAAAASWLVPIQEPLHRLARILKRHDDARVSTSAAGRHRSALLAAAHSLMNTWLCLCG